MKNRFKRIGHRGLMLISLLLLALVAAAENLDMDALINQNEITQAATPNLIPNEINTDVQPERSYPMQPPVIPHTIRGYEVNINTNKCMTCHSRQRTGESQAPMVSVTHYMNSDGNFLAEISPRRYFCTQCHVTQIDAKPLIENEFIDMHSLMQKKAEDK
jgi:cytochrome c-type protein NapB